MSNSRNETNTVTPEEPQDKCEGKSKEQNENNSDRSRENQTASDQSDSTKN